MSAAAGDAVVVVQARMTSRRLPGKVLAPLGGVPMLGFLLRRLAASTCARRCGVVATSVDASDNPVAALAQEEGWTVVRGPLDDVLGRYALVMERVEAKAVVRVTADNPLTDPVLLDDAVARLLGTGADYLMFQGLPVGVAADAFSRSALEDSAAAAASPYAREHINAHLLDAPDRYRLLAPDAPPALRRPGLRLTVDTADYLARLRALVKGLEQPWAEPLETYLERADALAAGAQRG